MRPRPLLLAVAASAALAAAPAVRAATISVALDHSLRLPFAGSAGSVVVGNPLVADVTVVDSRTVFVTGKATGSTDVTVIDPLGRTLFNGGVRVTGESGRHVVVHRGAADRADLSCDPACTPTAAAGGAGGGSSATPAGAVSPAGVMGGALAGAAGGAISGAISGGLHPPA